MPKLRPFIAQVRIGLGAESEIHAESQLDYLCAQLTEHLDDDDSVRVTQIVHAGEPEVQEETLTRLRLARNELVRLNYKEGMDLAQQLDMVIWKLIRLASDDDSLPNDYNYNRIVTIAHALKRGENPLY